MLTQIYYQLVVAFLLHAGPGCLSVPLQQQSNSADSNPKHSLTMIQPNKIVDPETNLENLAKLDNMHQKQEYNMPSNDENSSEMTDLFLPFQTFEHKRDGDVPTDREVSPKFAYLFNELLRKVEGIAEDYNNQQGTSPDADYKSEQRTSLEEDKMDEDLPIEKSLVNAYIAKTEKDRQENGASDLHREEVNNGALYYKKEPSDTDEALNNGAVYHKKEPSDTEEALNNVVKVSDELKQLEESEPEQNLKALATEP